MWTSVASTYKWSVPKIGKPACIKNLLKVKLEGDQEFKYSMMKVGSPRGQVNWSPETKVNFELGNNCEHLNDRSLIWTREPTDRRDGFFLLKNQLSQKYLTLNNNVVNECPFN